MRHLLVLAGMVALPTIAGSQSVRGVVLGRADSVGVSGAVVLLLDGTGKVVARALSNERGEFRLSAPTVGSYVVRTMRIGYRPVSSNQLVLASGQDVELPPIVAGAAVVLDTVRVVGRNVCRMHGDSAVSTYALWEQARTALTATDLTARVRTMAATIVTYERSLDPGTGRVREQSAGIRSGFTVRPWIARSADSLRRFGYIDQSLSGWVTYSAPDLEVLLSSAFLEDHCFKIARASDANRVGLEFEPIEERKELPEIRGVVWLDRKSAELQKMEFRYTNVLREQERSGAGGEMDFVRMKNGAWAIARWHIRMPLIVERPAETSRIPGMRAEPERRVTDIRIAGGEISLIALGTDTLWSRPPLAMQGTVVDSLTGAPLANAKVSLKGTRLEALTDVSGRFRIPGVLPGEYSIEVSTPAMDSVGLVQKSEIVFADESVRMVVRLRKRGLFYGFVLADSSGRPIPGAVVALPEIAMSTQAGEDGRFRLFDIPPGFHSVAVHQPGFVGVTVKIQFEPNRNVSRRFVLQLARTPTAALASAKPKSTVQEFEQRRAGGGGHYVTREQLEKRSSYRLADVLSTLPGVRIIRSPEGPQAWVASGRGKSTILNERQPDRSNAERGAPEACYSDVYLDGTLVYGGSGGNLFDVNTLVPTMLEGIEAYVAGGHVPAEYNRLGAACGVVLFWTRRG